MIQCLQWVHETTAQIDSFSPFEGRRGHKFGGVNLGRMGRDCAQVHDMKLPNNKNSIKKFKVK